MDDLRPGRSGVRAMLLNNKGDTRDDFRIETTDRSIHVLNALCQQQLRHLLLVITWLIGTLKVQLISLVYSKMCAHLRTPILMKQTSLH